MPRKPATKPKHFFQIKYGPSTLPTIVKRRLVREELGYGGTRVFRYGPAANARVHFALAALTLDAAKKKLCRLLDEQIHSRRKAIARLELDMAQLMLHKRDVMAMEVE